MDDITDEEKVQIATGFLLSSPPGEYNEVVTDVRALVGNDSLLNQHFASTSQEYNTEQCIMLQPPNGEHMVVICKQGEVSATEYLDPRGQQIVTVDHVKQEITGTSATTLNSTMEPYRSAVDDAVAAYVQNHYPQGACSVFSDDGNITIVISSKKFSPANFWNGRWRSIWSLNFSPGDASGNIEGTFKLAVHYYEDGNVQLNTETEKSVKCKIGSPEQIGKNLVSAISKAEDAYESGIAESYMTMGERSFKGLRRRLPITRSPMEWTKAVGYGVGRQIGGSS